MIITVDRPVLFYNEETGRRILLTTSKNEPLYIEDDEGFFIKPAKITGGYTIYENLLYYEFFDYSRDLELGVHNSLTVECVAGEIKSATLKTVDFCQHKTHYKVIVDMPAELVTLDKVLAPCDNLYKVSHCFHVNCHDTFVLAEPEFVNGNTMYFLIRDGKNVKIKMYDDKTWTSGGGSYRINFYEYGYPTKDTVRINTFEFKRDGISSINSKPLSQKYDYNDRAAACKIINEANPDIVLFP